MPVKKLTNTQCQILTAKVDRNFHSEVLEVYLSITIAVGYKHVILPQ